MSAKPDRVLIAKAERELIRQRLRDEGEHELLVDLAVCGQEMELVCLNCQSVKKVEKQCKRRWCPSCARQLAARRSAELQYIVARFRWPLFVTLTMGHGSSANSGEIRKLRRAFGKLRHRVCWSRTVKGGIASVEINNEAGGWHPHLHVVCDCRWLALKIKEPRRDMSIAEKKEVYIKTSAELGELWASILGQPSASVRIKRADRLTIAKEVVKYTLKGSDLITSAEPIGSIIRAIAHTRLMTTFGRAHGQTVRDIRAAAKVAARLKRSEPIKTLSNPLKTNNKNASALDTSSIPDANYEPQIKDEFLYTEAGTVNHTPNPCFCGPRASWYPRELWDREVSWTPRGR